jgi:lipid II:glycine glycyltransferase (peptidoglycan interpeptide bridge formation enzyme)
VAKVQAGVKPTHSLEELLEIHSLCPDALHLFVAMAYGEPVAGILLFQATPLVVNTFYIADVEAGRDARAVDLLLLETYKWALEHSIRWVDLGPSSSRLEVHWTLTQFKETHGGRIFLRRPYVWRRSPEAA